MRPTGSRVDAGAASQQARWKNARIVQDQAIARMKVRGEVAEGAVFPSSFGSMQDEHTRGGAVGKRLLRNQILGQMKIEGGQIHRQASL